MKQIYTSTSSIVKSNKDLLLGVQRIVNCSDKVLVWFRLDVERPIHTRTQNKGSSKHEVSRYTATARRKEYIKNVWGINQLLKQFPAKLENRLLNGHTLLELIKENSWDIWRTNNDGDRDFIGLFIEEPISEITGERMRAEVIQSITPPREAEKRALIEAAGDTKEFHRLYNKYKNKAIVRRYNKVQTNYGTSTVRVKKLEDYYVNIEGQVHLVYEHKRVTPVKPINVFLENNGLSRSFDYDYHNNPYKELSLFDSIENRVSENVSKFKRELL